MNTPDFDSLSDALQALGATAEAHPAELHGLACGILAAGFLPAPEQWLREAATYLERASLPVPPDSPLVHVYTGSRRLLEEGDFAFSLCLPDDDLYGLPERSESLARWCQGFLHGFAAVQAPLSDDNQELLRDLAEISRLQIEADDIEEDGEEENERYYSELTEFVRMAALSLFMDHHTTDKDAATPPHARH